MSVEPLNLLAIIAMALATGATRLAGYALMRGRRPAGRWQGALDAVPPAVLMAVIAPGLFLAGPAEMVAGALAAVAALRLPLLAVVAIGVGAVVVLRAAGF